MADFPTKEMSDELPFMYSGADLFGQFVLKNGSYEVKRYDSQDLT